MVYRELGLARPPGTHKQRGRESRVRSLGLPFQRPGPQTLYPSGKRVPLARRLLQLIWGDSRRRVIPTVLPPWLGWTQTRSQEDAFSTSKARWLMGAMATPKQP